MTNLRNIALSAMVASIMGTTIYLAYDLSSGAQAEGNSAPRKRLGSAKNVSTEKFPADRWELRRVLMGWSEGDLQTEAQSLLSALQRADDLDDKKARTLVEIVRAWSVRNPGEALEFCAKIPPNLHGSIAQNTAMELWAARDLPGAREWLNTFFPNIRTAECAHALLSGLVQGAGRASMKDAIQLLQDMADKKDAGSLAAKAGAEFALVYPMVALQQTRWGNVKEFLAEVAQLPEGNCREQLTQATVDAWTEVDARTALTLALESPPSEHRRTQIISMVQNLAETSAKEAAALFVQSGIEDEETPRLIYHEWARQDLASFAAWVNEQPAGALLDTQRAEIALAYLRFDPNVAKLWASSIQDERMRTEIQKKLEK